MSGDPKVHKLALDFYGTCPVHDPRNRLADREVWDHWVSVWRARTADDWDNLIVVDGERGSGKSTLAMRIATALDPAFDETRVALSAAEMLDFWGRLPRGSAAVYDEAVFGLLSRRFASPENVALVQACMAARKLGITVVLCIPDLMILDSAFRESAVKYRVFVERRGEATVHIRSERIRYDQSKPRRFYRSFEWNPLRWQPLPEAGLWGRYRERAELAVREWSSRAAATLRSSGKLSSSVSSGARGLTRVERRWDPQKRVRCDRCESRVRADGLAQHRKSTRCLGTVMK
jgi:hypothetical protein